MMLDEKSLQELLIKCAKGYEYEEREAVIDKNGNGTGKIKVIKKVKLPSEKAINTIRRMMKNGEWK